MLIQVVSGQGEGRTLLSSFDAALKDTGVYNYNLIYLSSVVPPQANIQIVNQYNSAPNECGQRMYVVAADERSDQVGQTIGAGIGWYQFEDGRGVFVEHHVKGMGTEEMRNKLKKLIADSIHDLCDFRSVPYDPQKLNMYIETKVVQSKPATVLVLAVFKVEPW